MASWHSKRYPEWKRFPCKKIKKQLSASLRFIKEFEKASYDEWKNSIHQHYYRLAKGFMDTLQQTDPTLITVIKPEFKIEPDEVSSDEEELYEGELDEEEEEKTEVNESNVTSSDFRGFDISFGNFPSSTDLDSDELKGTYFLDRQTNTAIQLDLSTMMPKRAFRTGDSNVMFWNGMGTILARYPEVYPDLKMMMQ